MATGIISEGEIAPPTRLILRKQENAQVLLGDVTHVDLANKTVTSELLGHDYVTPYDSLIIAAGAGQSYFGNDHFAEFAPGMKSIDDALELRGRILGAFEQAERSSDPVRRDKLLTFVVVGAGPTGVEMAGQIAGARRPDAQGQLPAHRPHRGARHPARRRACGAAADGQEARAQGAGAPGEDGRRDSAQRDGHRRRPQRHHRQGPRRHRAAHRGGLKVWSAGVSASPLGRDLAEQSDTEIDRAGRVKVLPDLSIPGHPNVFVIGDMAYVEGVPGMAQGAIQGAKYVSKIIKNEAEGPRARHHPQAARAVQLLRQGVDGDGVEVQRGRQVGKLEFGGFIAWLAWLGLHLIYLVGFKTKVATLMSWTVTFLSRERGNLTITEQQAYARTRIEQLEDIAAAVRETEKAAS